VASGVALESIRICWRLENAIAVELDSPCIPLNTDFNILWGDSVKGFLIDQTALHMLDISQIPKSMGISMDGCGKEVLVDMLPAQKQALVRISAGAK
jgi:hypothetical protein